MTPIAAIQEAVDEGVWSFPEADGVEAVRKRLIEVRGSTAASRDRITRPKLAESIVGKAKAR